MGEPEEELARVRAEFATFSSRLAHDLRGIFSNIDGFAGALQEQAGGKLTDKEARYLQRIAAGARRGDSVVRDLALLSATAVAQMQPQALDFGALVRQAIRDLAPQLAGRALDWELADGDWPQLVADPALLRLAVDQLLANAAKFTRGQAHGRVRVELQGEASEWVVAVTDNGAGFDPAYADRLFQAFERLHLPTEFEGNGIGLAVVKLVAQRHGGGVQAQALAGGGARFAFSLRRRAAEAMPVQAPADEAPAEEATARRPLRVLVVDDEPLVLATVKAMLERDGHQVLAAAGGLAGLQALAQQGREARRFDLVLTDWLMPGASGADVVQAARASDPAVRILVLTGQRPQVRGGPGIPGGVDGLLQKPLRPAELRRAVQAVMGARPGAA